MMIKSTVPYQPGGHGACFAWWSAYPLIDIRDIYYRVEPIQAIYNTWNTLMFDFQENKE